MPLLHFLYQFSPSAATLIAEYCTEIIPLLSAAFSFAEAASSPLLRAIFLMRLTPLRFSFTFRFSRAPRASKIFSASISSFSTFSLNNYHYFHYRLVFRHYYA